MSSHAAVASEGEGCRAATIHCLPSPVQHRRLAGSQVALFGSDYPLITPDRWPQDFKEAGFEPEVHEPILKTNALRALGLVPAS
jgi:predicted TIM-barrel fold metal-dependent hydrolase